MTNFESEPKPIGINYTKWAEALDNDEIFGPMYYINEDTWYIDARIKESPRDFDVMDLDGLLPDRLRRIEIPRLVAARFQLRTPPEPPYFIH